MEPISEVKEIVQKLESKLKSSNTSEYGKKETFEGFVRPLFESLGWDFATDVSKEESVSQNKADYGFKIDDVTRFYLTTVPLDQSLEDRELIIPLTTFAFNRGVTWGVLTNFRKTRLYMSEARGRSPAHMQFFELSSEEFLSKFEKLSYLTKKSLSLNTLDSDAVYFAKKQKKTPIDQQLLEDLLDHRDRLSKNIIKNNPKLTQEQVSHSVQKILNRFIFIRSCGDRQIEERHLQSSLNQWREEKKKRDLIEYVRNIFSEFRGRYGSSLFEKHICDNLQISNFVLEEIIEGLYQSENKAVRYDFSLIGSDILGKMYENYLGTIQRKQDGAYYTPNYISKYIAENTIIPYLSKSNVTNISDLISEYADNIKELELKIHSIKILDPACGTGEFLIRAIDILLEILNAIQNLKEKGGKYSHTGKKKKSESVTYATFDKEIEGQELRTIIQNNIFGVDINEEAIEITQLNLFLKLATSSKQLPDVSKNLRVGNSLIDDKSVDPKAFDWEKAFPEKFDIVIGNPPYVRQEELSNFKPYFEKNYKCYDGIADLYVYFLEKEFGCLKDSGHFGVIVSSQFTRSRYGINLRKFLSTKIIEKFIYFRDLPVFGGVTTYPCIMIIKNEKIKSNHMMQFTNVQTLKFNSLTKYVKENKESIDQKNLDENEWQFIGKKSKFILEKMRKKGSPLVEFAGVEMFRGIMTGLNEAFIINKKTYLELIQEDSKCKEIIKPIVSGKEIHRYEINFKEEYIIFIPWSYDLEYSLPIKNHLLKFRKQLEKRPDVKSGRMPWWTMSRYGSNYHHLFERPKIFYRGLSLNGEFPYMEKPMYVNAPASMISAGTPYLSAILQSKLIWFYIINKCPLISGGFRRLYNNQIEKIPIVIDEQETKKINSIVKELENLKKKYRSVDKNNLENIKNEIKLKENDVDELVYKLYNITDEEKKIIESSL